MNVQVMLMSDVEKLGSEGSVVSVAAGYARNYLFPRKLAAPVTDATRKRLAKLQKEREETRKARLEEAQKKAEGLAKLSITLPVKVSKEEKLYGSVTSQMIAAAIREQGVVVEEADLDLPEPLKELGVYDVKVKLHPDVEASIKVWVVEE